MPRVAHHVMQGYHLINADSSMCHYCGSPAVATDFTPHPSALPRAGDMPKTMARVCRTCYNRIYYANVGQLDDSRRCGAALGLMTDKDKVELCQSPNRTRTKDLVSTSFMKGFDGTLVVPTRLRIQEDFMYVDGIPWSMAELRALQGPMALRMANMPETIVAECFWTILIADEQTKTIDIQKSMTMLNIHQGVDDVDEQ